MNYPLKKWAKRRPGIIIPVFFLSLFMTMHGQVYNPDARCTALGNISSVSGAECHPAGNPASLGTLKNSLFSIEHSSPFLLKEIGISSLKFALPVNPGNFQFSLSSYGLKAYRNMFWKLGYGMVLGEKLSAGVGFQFYQTVASGELAYLWNIGIEGGLIYQFSEVTSLGLHIINPVSFGNYAEYGSIFPSILTIGLAHKLYKGLQMFAEISQFSTGSTQIKTGFEYKVNPDFILRAGYHSVPHALSFGSANSFGKFTVHMSFSWSVVPGFTPSLQLQYFLK